MTAEEFRVAFIPNSEINYDWVVQYARDEYARGVEAFKGLDEKAAAVGNYLGAGSGLLTLGAVAGVSAGQIEAWTVVAAVPSIVLALAALIAAVHARKTVSRPAPCRVANAVMYAEFHKAQGAAGFLGQWEETISGMALPLALKAKRVDRSLNLFALAVVALAIPLALAVVRKLGGLPG